MDEKVKKQLEKNHPHVNDVLKKYSRKLWVCLDLNGFSRELIEAIKRDRK